MFIALEQEALSTSHPPCGFTTPTHPGLNSKLHTILQFSTIFFLKFALHKLKGKRVRMSIIKLNDEEREYLSDYNRLI